MMRKLTMALGLMLLGACSPGGEPQQPDVEIDPPGNPEIKTGDTSPDGRTFTLTIPAQTYARNMDTDFRVMKDDAEIATLFADLTEQENVSPIAYPVELTFDAAQVAQQDGMEIILELTLEEVDRADAAGNSIYAYLLEEGERLQGQPDGEDIWSFAFGYVERLADSALLHVRLFASAEKMTLVPVIGERFNIYTSLTDQSSGARRLALQSGASDPNLLYDPWAVLCLSSDPVVCDAAFESDSPLVKITVLLDVAAGFYHDMGFTEAAVSRYPLSVVIQASTDLDAPLGVDADEDPESQVMVNLAVIRDPLICAGEDAVGCYSPSTRLISLSVDAAETDPQDQGDAPAHELFHAIQAHVAPDLYSAAEPNSWIIEATAEAQSLWKLSVSTPEALLLSKTHGEIRNWAFSLQDESDDLRPYRTWEFFANQYEGDLNWLVDFFDFLNLVDVSQHPYQFMDEAFGDYYETFGSPKDQFFEMAVSAQSESFILGLNETSNLGIAYLNMVTQVNPDTGYEHCTQTWTIDIPADAQPKIDSISDTINPMSMDCLRAISSDHSARHGNACIKLTLESSDSNGDVIEVGNTDLRTALVITGAEAFNEQNLPQTISFDGEPLWVHSSDFTAQIVDLNLEEAVAKAPDESERMWTLHAEIDDTCGDQAECFPTRVTCYETACYLEMNAPSTDCWISIAKWDGTGYYVKIWNQWEPSSMDECLEMSGLLEQSFHNRPQSDDEDEVSSWTVPVDVPMSEQTCGRGFCRRILLCAK